jgi:hypothetical protein
VRCALLVSRISRIDCTRRRQAALYQYTTVVAAALVCCAVPVGSLAATAIAAVALDTTGPVIGPQLIIGTLQGALHHLNLQSLKGKPVSDSGGGGGSAGGDVTPLRSWREAADAHRERKDSDDAGPRRDGGHNAAPFTPCHIALWTDGGRPFLFVALNLPTGVVQ